VSKSDAVSDVPQVSTKQAIGVAYAGLGAFFGIAAGVITFIATWFYCAVTYGFVLGLGLGWFPAAVCAGVVGWLVAIFWGFVLVVLALGIGALLAIAISTQSTILAYAFFGGLAGWVMWRFAPKSLTGRQ
jgi:hypothetical protein